VLCTCAHARSLENAGDEIGGKAHELLLLLVGGSCGGRRAARRQLRGSCHSWGRAGPGKRQSAYFPAVFSGNASSNQHFLPDTDPLPANTDFQHFLWYQNNAEGRETTVKIEQITTFFLFLEVRGFDLEQKLKSYMRICIKTIWIYGNFPFITKNFKFKETF
jgi:hypothetical protein